MLGLRRQRLKTSTMVVALLLSFVAVVVAGSADAAASCARVASDFNGDGHADVAAGEPGRDVGTAQGAGALRVLAGNAVGVASSFGSTYYDESSFPGLGAPAAGDEFGSQTVSGYFNSDCYADLAVAARGQIPSAVYVIYGSPGGLVPSSAQKFTGTQIEGQAAGRDNMGSALAVGDFNGDGHTDLAMGMPQAHDPNGGVQGGGVGILYGTASGLSLAGKSFITQASAGVPGASVYPDEFGLSLAANDFNGDGRTDLAVGAPGKSVGTVGGAGTVTVLPGSASGLTGTGSRLWSQDTMGVPGVAEVDDHWGFALAAGDITGDGRADLVIGAPGESIGDAQQAGAITFLRGSSGGLTAAGSRSLSQDSTGVPGVAETGDQLGRSLTVGDFNGDGHADVAAGAPFESLPPCLLGDPADEAGTVDVFYGTSTGLGGSRAQAWSQGSSGLHGFCEAGDWFGFSLQALEVRSTGHADLIVGVPGEDSGTDDNNGMIQPIFGGPAGLTNAGNETITTVDLVPGAQVNGQLGMTWF